MFSDVSLSPALGDCKNKLGNFFTYHCNWIGILSILISLYITMVVLCCSHYLIRGKAAKKNKKNKKNKK